MRVFHTPVLLNECLSYLKPCSDFALFVDGTLGEGGHTLEFLKTYPTISVIGVDADPEIQAVAKKRLSGFKDRVRFYGGWSNELFENYSFESRPDLILVDLGISVFHYAESGRGFSFSKDEPLDMRLNSNLKISARDIVNSYEEKALADLIYEYGEEKYSRRIASAIVSARNASPFETSKDLADCIFSAVPARYRHGRLHPATRSFQALRIVVNKELERLPVLLEEAFNILKCNGKFGVISFHSLEDRIVKNYFRDLSKSCTCPPNMPICRCEGEPKAQLLTKKAVKPTEEEVLKNPPSRSARLRVLKKLKEVER
ncbi:MAG: 16S rRNA (cytosine(1402)-N(4))-methyltransferase [Treponema sp.]|nr:MAG: 16S rRNA (cytosine(1402)-N(4))-methyltransferase [Treponema sp.]